MPTRRLLTALVAIGAVAGSLSSTARANPPDPILWTGVVHTPDGLAAPGIPVVAYARPPAVQLKEGDRLVDVAHDTTDRSGHFTLRALPGGPIAALADESGWVTFMVTAVSPAGMTMAVDSLAWKPEGDYSGRDLTTHGRWVTSPEELFSSEGRYSSQAVNDRARKTEHPEVLSLAPAERVFRPKATAPDPGCGLYKEKNAGVHPVAVGELFLHPHWGGQFIYTNTKSTSFEVGLKMDDGSWMAKGTATVSKEHKMESGRSVPPAASSQFFGWQAGMIFKHYTWICGDGNTGIFYSEQTIEPVDWNGTMIRVSLSSEPPCSPNRDYHATVDPHGYLDRHEGGSLTLNGAINVVGFSGSVTSTVSNAVHYHWDNDHPSHRDVCPSTNYLFNDTRVTTQS